MQHGSTRLTRANFIRLIAASVGAVAGDRLADWLGIGPKSAAAFAGGDDWHDQKLLITTKEEYSAWVDSVVENVTSYRDSLGDTGQEANARAAAQRAIDELPATKVTAGSDLDAAKALADRLLEPIKLVQLANALGAAGLTLYGQLLALILGRIVAALGGSEDATKIPWGAMNSCLDFIIKGLEKGNDKDKKAAEEVKEIKRKKDEVKKLVEKGKDFKQALEDLKKLIEDFLRGRQ